jgi:hypothetical protein
LLGRWFNSAVPKYAAFSERFPFFDLCAQVGLLLVMFLAVETLLISFLRYQPVDYERPILLFAAADKIGVSGVLILLIGTVFLFVYGKLWSPWSALQRGSQLRLFVLFLAGVVAWPLSTWGYNYYHDQGYYLDCILMLTMLPLIWYRPVFIYPFLLLAFLLLWQLGAPLLNSGSHFAHKLQVLHVLNMFGAVFLVHALFGRRRTDLFYFFALCLVAAAYWQPALTKLKLNWIAHGQLYHMPLAAYAHGWLSFLDPETMVNFSRFVSWFDWPMRVFVLAIEVGCLFILYRRRAPIILLGCLTVFHAGVFLVYGYLFWTWMFLNLALIVILWRDRGSEDLQIFSTGHFFLSALLIGFGAHWCAPPFLGWYDTRLSYSYRYQAIGDSGTRYTVPARFFTPYSDVFAMGNFSYLVKDHAMLVASYGITGNAESALGLMTARTADEVFELEGLAGTTRRYSPERKQTFDGFIQRYMANRNEGRKEPIWLRYLRPPPLFWNFPRGHVYRGQEPLRSLTVNEITTLYDDESLFEIRKVVVSELPLEGLQDDG